MGIDNLKAAITNQENIEKLQKLKLTGLDKLIAINDISADDKPFLVEMIDAKIAQLQSLIN